jgi:potassium/chloride transporter 4/5/6
MGQLPVVAPTAAPAATSTKGHHGKKLGVLKGVLVPTCENMWGVLIFLRFYTIVAYAGLGLSIIIVTISFGVALFTTNALSAIATCGTSHNLAGVYPMLARALGKEIATATGLVYFLGIISLAVLECLGACEELFALDTTLELTDFRFDHYNVRMWGSIFMLSLVLFIALGIQFVSKLGLAFYAVVLLTLLSMYISLLGAPNLIAPDAPSSPRECPYVPPNASGSSSGSGGHSYIWPCGQSAENFANNWGEAFEGDYDFGKCLSLFFPCFTGILSGANRASSLRNPSTAIPKGTFGAISFSYVMYMSLMILFAGVGARDFLLQHHGQVNTLFYPSVAAAQFGIILSSLGQALQCLVVAPRLLSAIAASGTLPLLKPLAKLTAGEPKRALFVSYIIGGCLVMLGSLDAVAPLLSMCFLICYACMNLNCFFLDFLKDPHWRPRWKYFHWTSGLMGFVLCVTIMFLISPVAAGLAWLLQFLLLALIMRTNLSVDWGSAIHGLRFHIAIRSLLSIDMGAHLDENWKPQLLLLYTLREVEQHQNIHHQVGGYVSTDGTVTAPSQTPDSTATSPMRMTGADLEAPGGYGMLG